jgi:alanine-glyoxylate transaminase/serine-glyoxylate transaminase/serine-pyruvate transaminase
MSVLRGRNFLMTPGPSSVPERVLRAMARNSVDLGGADFVAMTRSCIDDLKPVFRTDGSVFAFISNGHGAWEAAVTNVIGADDHVLVPSTGHFGHNWGLMTQAVTAHVDVIPNDWRSAVDPQQIEDRLRADSAHRIKAVLLVHTDTATGITNDIPAVRAAIDAANHPALFMVDAVASLGTVDFRMDEWGVDVTVSASQKGLMSPAGLGFTAVGPKALAAAKDGGAARYYWDWHRRSSDEWYRWFCGTAPQHVLFALREALDMLNEEGMEQVFARHRRLAQMTRAAVACWNRAGAIGLNAHDPATASDSITAVRVADHLNAWDIKRVCGERLNVTLGGGLGQLDGKVFRIAHMGDSNEATILGALGAVEAAFRLCDFPFETGLDTAVQHMLDA